MQGVSKNIVGNCVLTFFLAFCPRSIFTCSVTVCSVLVLPDSVTMLGQTVSHFLVMLGSIFCETSL